MNTFDIETFRIDDKCIPYCVSYIVNNKNYSFYFNNEDIVLLSIKTIFDLMSEKIIFYVHNLKFDGSLIVESLSKQKKILINSLIENREIYIIELEYNKKKIIFRCSYKLLPLSLSNIASGFNLNKKIDYPYNFISKETIF
jgi:hypothetical protein